MKYWGWLSGGKEDMMIEEKGPLSDLLVHWFNSLIHLLMMHAPTSDESIGGLGRLPTHAHPRGMVVHRHERDVTG